ncbi:hypothetical protein [Nocardia sp. NPDC049149]|uniref:hypothetical protein n=1 Tax=Nocardia sp. NPDC049149 TaxID=3364315 RepID=UPI003719523F
MSEERRATDEQIAEWSAVCSIPDRARSFVAVLDALLAERIECESRFTVAALDTPAVVYMGDDRDWLAWGCRPRDAGEGHDGHVSHGHASHPGQVKCSCGEFLGLYCWVMSDDWVDPPPCPLCPPDRREGSTP